MLACGGARPRRSAGQLDPLGEPAQAAPLEHYPVPVGARVVTATRPAPEGPVRMKGRSRGESAASGIGAEEGSAAAWQKVLVDGQETLKRAQRVFRHLPSAPRCKLCQNPFRGVGGRVMGLAGFKPSRKNPNLCARCCDSLPPGGLELDIAVLFAGSGQDWSGASFFPVAALAGGSLDSLGVYEAAGIAVMFVGFLSLGRFKAAPSRSA